MNTLLRILPLVLLAAGMFINPQDVLASAAEGLNLWWRFVLPALLPFFILSELLIGQGFVHFLGVMLEPLMRPLFHLPGKASFVVVMGYTSGFPLGAILTARLRKQAEITREEGQRLLAFTNNPSPGFMFGAVASGMLGKPGLGIILASAVYLANLTVGFLFRFYRSAKNSRQPAPTPSLKKAFQEMKQAQALDARPFGQILGDSIRNSVTTVITVGGFVVFFSVVIRLLTTWHISETLAVLLQLLSGGLLPLERLVSIINGLFEMTLGCQGTIQNFPVLSQQIAVLSFLLGWSGLSVFAQIASFTAETDLKMGPFVFARILHAFIALGLSQLLLLLVKVPATTDAFPQTIPTTQLWLNTWQQSFLIFLCSIGFLLILSLLYQLWNNYQNR
ncbi:MAG: sporulation integral membrane protein YlbJ [Desulfitobacteriaceae bacterium]|nr:sporulation integral membrane protein YlbJ [Desulfitobacteriaceae bacterium]MDD4346316.1 sporulation integral membrane protein YlbJ [Desulfitobacteriaceae bacterium]MDD4400554.1 sporulation integral membrane protein YlbJ [Desulfitobacteriaceae bacterium]